MNEFLTALGDFFEWTFTILPVLNNGPNVFFILVITGYFFYWMGQMRKHQRAGER
jgi:uncharacterized membrane protein YozB (DUF420 family)